MLSMSMWRAAPFFYTGNLSFAHYLSRPSAGLSISYLLGARRPRREAVGHGKRQSIIGPPGPFSRPVRLNGSRAPPPWENAFRQQWNRAFVFSHRAAAPSFQVTRISFQKFPFTSVTESEKKPAETPSGTGKRQQEPTSANSVLDKVPRSHSSTPLQKHCAMTSFSKMSRFLAFLARFQFCLRSSDVLWRARLRPLERSRKQTRRRLGSSLRCGDSGHSWRGK